MATAGQGDVLAGVCGGFIAQGESLLVSAVLGTYLCGRASELAISSGAATQQSLTAGDTLRHLPAALLPTPVKMEYPPCSIAMLVISSWISTVFPTPAPPKSPIFPPFAYGARRSIDQYSSYGNVSEGS